MLGRMRRTRDLRDQLFREMMRRFGVTQSMDYGCPEGTMLHTAAARCIHCSQAGRCRAWMDTSEGTDGASEFCPNAATFSALGRRSR